MADPFRFFDSVTAPAKASDPVTPSDSVPLRILPKAVYVGTGGDVALRGPNDVAPRVFKNVPSGSIIPLRAEYVCATGTTASNMLALR